MSQAQALLNILSHCYIESHNYIRYILQTTPDFASEIYMSNMKRTASSSPVPSGTGYRYSRWERNDWRKVGEALENLKNMFQRLEDEVRTFAQNQDKPNRVRVSRAWVQRASGLRQVIFSSFAISGPEQSYLLLDYPVLQDYTTLCLDRASLDDSITNYAKGKPACGFIYSSIFPMTLVVY